VSRDNAQLFLVTTWPDSGSLDALQLQKARGLSGGGAPLWYGVARELILDQLG
jgi:hypothetical protein